LHSANYTGRTLRPLSPVLEPEDVAKGIVGLALRPQRALHMGLQHVVAPGYMLAPETSGRLAGRFLQRFLFQFGPRANITDGILFKPVAGGTGTRGGWGDIEAERSRTMRSIGMLGLITVAGLVLARLGSNRMTAHSSR
jgi:hypothetical protein